MSAHVDPLRLDASSGEERAVWLRHAAGCSACRRAIAAYDPSLLFALLSEAPIPGAVLDAVSAGTSRRIAAAERVMPARAAAAAVAVVALVSTALVLRSTLPPREGPPSMAAVPRADVEFEGRPAVSPVVDFTVGDTQVVLVYNPELEL